MGLTERTAAPFEEIHAGGAARDENRRHRRRANKPLDPVLEVAVARAGAGLFRRPLQLAFIRRENVRAAIFREVAAFRIDHDRRPLCAARSPPSRQFEDRAEHRWRQDAFVVIREDDP